MTVRAFCFTAMIAPLFVPQCGFADLMHTYTGTPFVEVSGDDFTTDDFVSGYVTFLTQPVPGAPFDQNDVESFSFSAGPLTIDSDTGTMIRGSFGFSAEGDIVGWDLDVTAGVTEIITGSDPKPLGFDTFGYDIAIRDLDGVSRAIGSWQAVPEPSAMFLWSAVGGIGLMIALGHRRCWN